MELFSVAVACFCLFENGTLDQAMRRLFVFSARKTPKQRIATWTSRAMTAAAESLKGRCSLSKWLERQGCLRKMKVNGAQ